MEEKEYEVEKVIGKRWENGEVSLKKNKIKKKYLKNVNL